MQVWKCQGFAIKEHKFKSVMTGKGNSEFTPPMPMSSDKLDMHVCTYDNGSKSAVLKLLTTAAALRNFTCMKAKECASKCSCDNHEKI